jgi:hypothetical protein
MTRVRRRCQSTFGDDGAGDEGSGTPTRRAEGERRREGFEAKDDAAKTARAAIQPAC